MRSIYVYGLFIVLCALLLAPALSQYTAKSLQVAEASKVQIDTYGDQIGTVQFPMSCSDASKPLVERGVALLHHMTYNGAKAAFTAATQTDPDCAMGYWGQAMTYIHPLWSDAPSKEDFERGQALVGEARARGQKTNRENAYIEAVGAYYEKGWNKIETSNLQSLEAAWENVYRRFPQDIEAACFYALAYGYRQTCRQNLYQTKTGRNNCRKSFGSGF